MCTTNIHTYAYPDGHRETVRVPELCPRSRHGIPCSGNVHITHPEVRTSHPGLSASVPTMGTQYLTTHFPPTPPSYSPRPSTPNYRSGDDSDMSGYRSASSSRSNRNSTALYVDGHEIYNVEHGHGSRRRRSSSRREHGTPPSPQSGSGSNRPIVINQNGRVDDGRAYRHGHERTTSSSSYSSLNSHRSHDDEEREAQAQRRKLREIEVAKQGRKMNQKGQDFHNRVEIANHTIANRPAIPSPPRHPKHATTYHPDELANAFGGLGIQERSPGRRERARREQEQAIEDELQEQRLRERLSRRRTVSSGSSRRHRILYDDGSYRWE